MYNDCRSSWLLRISRRHRRRTSQCTAGKNSQKVMSPVGWLCQMIVQLTFENFSSSSSSDKSAYGLWEIWNVSTLVIWHRKSSGEERKKSETTCANVYHRQSETWGLQRRLQQLQQRRNTIIHEPTRATEVSSTVMVLCKSSGEMTHIYVHLHYPRTCPRTPTSHTSQLYNYGIEQIDRKKTPPWGGFLFTMFPNQEPGRRGPPLKNHPQNRSIFSYGIEQI